MLQLQGAVESRAARFLADRGLAPYVRSSFFEQALVRPGEEVTVTGVVTREAAAAQEAGFRELQLQTRLTGYGRNPLTLRKARAG